LPGRPEQQSLCAAALPWLSVAGTPPGWCFGDRAEKNSPGRLYNLSREKKAGLPMGTPAQNPTHFPDSILSRPPLPQRQIHAMPMESLDLWAAATQYALALREIVGSPPVLDLVHLGLGADGHTASLVPGDSVLDVTDADVAPTGVYQGRRRMTLTFPMLTRARRIL